MGVRSRDDLLAAAVSPLVAGGRRCAAAAPRARRLPDLRLRRPRRARARARRARLGRPAPADRHATRAAVVRTHWGVEPGRRGRRRGGTRLLPGPRSSRRGSPRPARVRPQPAAHGGRRGALPDPGVLASSPPTSRPQPSRVAPVDQAVHGLVGAGRGLTPSGDDALCGVLLALASVDAPDAAARPSTVRAAVRRCSRARRASRPRSSSPPRRGMPSLTSCASSPSSPGPGRPAGRRAEPALAAQVLVRSGRLDLRRATTDITALVDRVLAIGHTSGRDLLSGVSGALRAVAARARPPPTTPPHEGAHRA